MQADVFTFEHPLQVRIAEADLQPMSAHFLGWNPPQNLHSETLVLIPSQNISNPRKVDTSGKAADGLGVVSTGADGLKVSTGAGSPVDLKVVGAGVMRGVGSHGDSKQWPWHPHRIL